MSQRRLPGVTARHSGPDRIITRSRYSWLVVDGFKFFLINERVEPRKGLVRFAIPEEYTEFVGLNGITIESASYEDADRQISNRLKERELGLYHEPTHIQLSL